MAGHFNIPDITGKSIYIALQLKQPLQQLIRLIIDSIFGQNQLVLSSQYRFGTLMLWTGYVLALFLVCAVLCVIVYMALTKEDDGLSKAERKARRQAAKQVKGGKA